MTTTEYEYPRLRPTIDAVPLGDEREQSVGLRDQSGISEGILKLSVPAFLMARMCDGTHRLVDIQAEFARRFGQLLFTEQLVGFVRQLDEAGFLESPQFDAHYASLVEAYRASEVRPMGALSATGADGQALSAEIAAILAEGNHATSDGAVVGAIAPHLDWPRGRPCYGRTYAALSSACRARRFVILGTNHFGQSTSVVATTKDFETPLGRARCDRAFLAELEQRLGQSLTTDEFDHRNEHSVELQVPFVLHNSDREGCTIVPVLCPDPCGPTGTAPMDGTGPDLAVFARALRDAIREDDTETCVIAGADLSHVGRQFGDDCDLGGAFLEEIASRDRAAMDALEASGAEGFRTHLQQSGNPSRICSAGSIYVLATALPEARPERLHYHQAADPSIDTCVTCAAYVFRAAE